MFDQPLDFIPIWVMLLVLVVLLLCAIEAGYRFGRWRHVRRPDEKEQPVIAIVASILGLVALIVGFTFSLAASRFDARRLVVLEEANAIGTTFLRARFLPATNQTNVEKLLREYVDVRLNGIVPGKLEESIRRSEELHLLLWEQADQAAKADAGSIMTGLFVQSLNEVIDLHAKRLLVGLRSRIPLVIWVGLFGLASLGMAAVGYQCGLIVTARSPILPALALAFAGVLMLIVDLDRGQEGLLQIGQQALSDLQISIRNEK